MAVEAKTIKEAAVIVVVTLRVTKCDE